MNKERDYSKIIKRLFILIGIGIAAHIVFLMFTIDPRTFGLLRKISPLSLLMIVFLAICPWLGHASRIVLWSHFLKYPVNFREALAIVMVNDVGAAITPSAVGGGPIKLGMLVNKGMPASKATFMVLLSATEDIIFYSCGIIVTFIFMQGAIESFLLYLSKNMAVMFLLIIVLLFPFVLKSTFKKLVRKFISLFPTSWQDRLANLRSRLSHYFMDIGQTYLDVFKRAKWRLLLSVFLLFFQWFSKFTILALLLIALGIEFTWFDMYVKQWIIWMGMLIIPTPGASGGAEAAFLLLFKGNMEGDLPNLIVSTWRFFTYYFILLLSLLLFNFFNKSAIKKH